MYGDREGGRLCLQMSSAYDRRSKTATFARFNVVPLKSTPVQLHVIGTDFSLFGESVVWNGKKSLEENKNQCMNPSIKGWFGRRSLAIAF